jgi:hypothetical protein
MVLPLATVAFLVGMSASLIISIAICLKWKSWAAMELLSVLTGFPLAKSGHCIAVIIFKLEGCESDSYFQMFPSARLVQTV